jgi:hypothetical protein
MRWERNEKLKNGKKKKRQKKRKKRKEGKWKLNVKRLNTNPHIAEIKKLAGCGGLLSATAWLLLSYRSRAYVICGCLKSHPILTNSDSFAAPTTVENNADFSWAVGDVLYTTA